jgi:hypothetical protein
MDSDLFPPRGASAHCIGPGPVTRQRVHARTCELAVLAGRVPPQVAQLDYEQAKRELTGETDPDRQEAILDWRPAAEGRPRAWAQ